MAVSAGRLASFFILACLFVLYIPSWFGVEIASRFVGVMFAISLAYVISGYFPPNSRLPVAGKAILITGCDTGE